MAGQDPWASADLRGRCKWSSGRRCARASARRSTRPWATSWSSSSRRSARRLWRTSPCTRATGPPGFRSPACHSAVHFGPHEFETRWLFRAFWEPVEGYSRKHPKRSWVQEFTSKLFLSKKASRVHSLSRWKGCFHSLCCVSAPTLQKGVAECRGFLMECY